MIRFRVTLIGCGLLMASSAAAQIVGRPFEFSGQAGWVHYDTRTSLAAAPGFGGTLGWRAQSWLVLEGNLFYSATHTTTQPELDRDFFGAGVDTRMNMRPAESRVLPYFIAGMGYMKTTTSGATTDELSRGSPSLGIGALFSLRGNQRNYVRAQIRDIFFRDRGAEEFANHFAVTIGIHHIWGGKPRDSDVDGVRDWLDTCPATPLGATVSAAGCPADADSDKVLDGIDKCQGTPVGCTVDKFGCSADPDSDGVCVGLDQCPDTPRGATVNAMGCPADPDSDRVFDGMDQCPNTPQGCTVDAQGCPSDADKDGVCDGKDQCVNTPEGWAVDANGCPTEVRAQESDLLDTGMIRVQVEFDTGKSTIKPASLPALAEAGRVLQQFPTLRIQVGGHTDDRGSAAANDNLSTERAAAVADYMKQNFPLIPAAQLSSRGYGSSQPIAPNSTSVGRTKNRRVEFKVLNTNDLKTEREKRQALRKGEIPK